MHLTVRSAARARLEEAGADRIGPGGPVWTVSARSFRLREIESGRRYEALVAPGAGLADLMRNWFSRVLLCSGGILLHAAAVIRNGRALLFSGPSGSGKSTLAKLAGSQTVLSDESVAVLPAFAGRGRPAPLVAHGTPFFGELAHAAANACAPIGAVFLIGPSRTPLGAGLCRVAPVSPARSAAELLAQTFLRTLSGDSAEALFPILEELAARTRVMRLEFAPEPGIWEGLDGLLE
ncbi:MAG: hypothetical protein WC713_03160 [Candidatus Methylomirabilota bacterium]